MTENCIDSGFSRSGFILTGALPMAALHLHDDPGDLCSSQHVALVLMAQLAHLFLASMKEVTKGHDSVLRYFIETPSDIL